MKAANTSETIARTPREVFAFVSDQRNEPPWHTDMLEVRVTSGEPVRLGTTFWYRFKPVMGMSEGTSTITAHEPDHRVVFAEEMGKLKPTTTITVEPDGEGCRVTRAIDMELTGLIRLMAPMAASMTRKKNVEFLANLKRVLEAG